MCLQCRRPRFNPWVRKILWRREWQPTPVFLPGETHEQRSKVGYSPQGRKEWELCNVVLASTIYQHQSDMGIHMAPPSWTYFLPPTPSHPSQLSRSTVLVLCINGHFLTHLSFSLISYNRASDKPHWLRYCHCTKLFPSL